MSFVTVTNPGA